MKDYDFELQYHPRKANAVANALSMKATGIVACFVVGWSLIKQLRDLSLGVQVEKKKITVRSLSVQP